jgi:hypothetical protein
MVNIFYKSLKEIKWHFFENIGKPLMTELRKVKRTLEEKINKPKLV